jgi:hypothetical protein
VNFFDLEQPLFVGPRPPRSESEWIGWGHVFWAVVIIAAIVVIVLVNGGSFDLGVYP